MVQCSLLPIPSYVTFDWTKQLLYLVERFASSIHRLLFQISATQHSKRGRTIPLREQVLSAHIPDNLPVFSNGMLLYLYTETITDLKEITCFPWYFCIHSLELHSFFLLFYPLKSKISAGEFVS